MITRVGGAVLAERGPDGGARRRAAAQPLFPESELARIAAKARDVAIARSQPQARAGAVRADALRRPSVWSALPDRGDAQGLHHRAGEGLPRAEFRCGAGASLRGRRVRCAAGGKGRARRVRHLGARDARRRSIRRRRRQRAAWRCSTDPTRCSRRSCSGCRSRGRRRRTTPRSP